MSDIYNLPSSYEAAVEQVQAIVANDSLGNDKRFYLELALIDALALMPHNKDPDTGFAVRDDSLHGPVVELFKGVPYTVFRELDEKPGRWGYKHHEFNCEWHWKLRSTRNNRRDLFDVLEKG